MYALAIVAAFALTVIAVQSVKLVEKKIGSSIKRLGINFIVPVFMLFAAANIFLAYSEAEPGYCLLFNTMLMAATVSSYQDLKYREIEDEIHIIAFVAGLAGLIARGFSPLDSFLGILAAGGTLLLIAILTRGGMGGADIKLNAVYGMMLGLKLSMLSLLLAFIAGALISLLLILLKIKGRKDVIPFSPFLSIGALISLAFGDSIINAYIRFILG